MGFNSGFKGLIASRNAVSIPKCTSRGRDQLILFPGRPFIQVEQPIFLSGSGSPNTPHVVFKMLPLLHFAVYQSHSFSPPPLFFKVFNLLKPTGYVMHHQFNIQQLYALPTLYSCVLYLSENKQRLVPLTA